MLGYLLVVSFHLNKRKIAGAGAVEMKFFTTVNVTDVKLHGTATRGEKIDVESYHFEGEVANDVLGQNKTDVSYV